MGNGRSIIKEVGISAAPEKVFRALTDASELGEWIAMSAESDPRPGGGFKYNWTSMSVGGTYGAIEPNVLIESHWDGWEPGQSTPVIWELTKTDTGTHVLMTNAGLDGPEWDEAYEGLSDG